MQSTKKSNTLIEFIGLIVFFITYKLSPEENATRYAAIALVLTSIFQIIYYKHNKIKMPNHVLGINVLSLALNIPAIIWNDFTFIRLKLLIIKALFFIVPFTFLILKKNFFYVIFGEMPGLEHFTYNQFKIINSWYLITSFIGLVISIYAYFLLNDQDFVTFKVLWLPLVGSIYLVPIFYYIVLNNKQ